MLKYENTEVMNFEGALRGMRNPLNSWADGDSYFSYDYTSLDDEIDRYRDVEIGEKDLKLAQKLIKAGSDHRKFMRQIFVSVDITAPLYWFLQFDTYKVGTVSNSCSKMHKLMEKPFTLDDFSFEHLPGYRNEIKQVRPIIDDEMSAKELSDTYREDLVVNHKDGNKLNNFETNLEWVTQSENIRHSYDNNLQPKGLSTYKGKFTEDQRNEIKSLWDNGELTIREIAEKYSVSHTCISDIVHDKYKYITHSNVFEEVAKPLIDTLNELRDMWLVESDSDRKKQIWYSIIQLLPESYNQKRTVTLNYETLRNIYGSRKHHKLTEWSVDFMAWIDSLPYADELIKI